jgi:hypothetical protein
MKKVREIKIQIKQLSLTQKKHLIQWLEIKITNEKGKEK